MVGAELVVGAWLVVGAGRVVGAGLVMGAGLLVGAGLVMGECGWLVDTDPGVEVQLGVNWVGSGP